MEAVPKPPVARGLVGYRHTPIYIYIYICIYKYIGTHMSPYGDMFRRTDKFVHRKVGPIDSSTERPISKESEHKPG